MQRERTVQTIHGVITGMHAVVTPILDDIIQWDESPIVAKILAGDDISIAHDEALVENMHYDWEDAINMNYDYDRALRLHPQAKPSVCTICGRMKAYACSASEF